MLTAIVGVSVPSFILASILMYFFSLKLKIFPATGWGTLKHLILPSLSLSSFSIAYIIRLIRSSMLDVLSQDYIKTAYSKGLATRTVVLKHALKNAIFPVVTYLGPLTAGILTGSFVIEKIFSIPGLGRMLVISIGNRDYTATLGITLFYSVLLVSFNNLVDIVYMILDPRVRLSKKQMI
jgi:oligopeptide transport system permease protein